MLAAVDASGVVTSRNIGLKCLWAASHLTVMTFPVKSLDLFPLSTYHRETSNSCQQNKYFASKLNRVSMRHSGKIHQYKLKMMG